MMERNAGKTRIAFGKTLQEICDSSKSQLAEENIASAKKGVLDMIIGNIEYVIKTCSDCELDHVHAIGQDSCVICSSRPKRPRSRKCLMAGCQNDYLIDSSIHIEISNNEGILINKESGVPVKIKSDDIVEATSRVFQAFYYIVGPLCEHCMNDLIGGFMVSEIEGLIVRIAVKRIQSKFLEDLI
tara:strand:+ start:8 stop:562 length:555 start_codon:yes stop_codon:yes gene_type:complete